MEREQDLHDQAHADRDEHRFGAGHRIRVEVTSSNFPKFVRNLNTGGPNESEDKGVVATVAIHHSGTDLSYIDLPVAGPSRP